MLAADGSVGRGASAAAHATVTEDKVRVIPWLALVLTLGCVPAARAAVFEIPEDEPVVSVALPDGWVATANVPGLAVDGVAADGGLEVHVTVVDERKAGDFQAALLAGDRASGRVPDPASEQRDSLHIAARRATDLTYRMAGPGDLRFRLLRMELVPGKVLFITFAGTAAAFTAHAADIAAIFDEVKPLDN
eukprot:gene37054-44328_t